VELTLATRDREHREQVVRVLEEHGYPIERIG
jgi:hypothetical protein